MKHPRTAVLAIAAGLLLAAACSESGAYTYVAPAQVEEVEADLWRIELTERAAERTGLATVEVRTENIDGFDRTVVPYSSIIYHFEGTTWAYTNPEPLVYLRAPVDIDFITGDLAVLNDGPDIGTTIVSVGAAELYGVEFGIGK